MFFFPLIWSHLDSMLPPQNPISDMKGFGVWNSCSLLCMYIFHPPVRSRDFSLSPLMHLGEDCPIGNLSCFWKTYAPLPWNSILFLKNGTLKMILSFLTARPFESRAARNFSHHWQMEGEELCKSGRIQQHHCGSHTTILGEWNKIVAFSSSTKMSWFASCFFWFVKVFGLISWAVIGSILSLVQFSLDSPHLFCGITSHNFTESEFHWFYEIICHSKIPSESPGAFRTLVISQDGVQTW